MIKNNRKNRTWLDITNGYKILAYMTHHKTTYYFNLLYNNSIRTYSIIYKSKGK